ncbi:histidine phosphotransferase family protein [Shimia sediminis]|uniref:histidine phosphotransferase family protein n=1 Tax=Shimia sediminis TaxID=2497945 RepID=UPI000F8C7A73|nr:histidine phosphotransferase family protein [Shimia sediminis]
MTQNNMDFSALVGSRICHDLISPVGAIGNGIELMGMGGTSGPELELISDSVGNANARIRFFRIAFGHAAAGQMVGSNEIRSVLTDLAQGARVRFIWEVVRDVDRPSLRAVFQALMCMETALPFGGEVTVRQDGDLWQIAARGQKLSLDDTLWSDLIRPTKLAEITPGRVQFGLLPLTVADLGKELKLFKDSETLALSF